MQCITSASAQISLAIVSTCLSTTFKCITKQPTHAFKPLFPSPPHQLSKQYSHLYRQVNIDETNQTKSHSLALTMFRILMVRQLQYYLTTLVMSLLSQIEICILQNFKSQNTNDSFIRRCGHSGWIWLDLALYRRLTLAIFNLKITVYVADSENRRVRMISSSDNVATLAWSGNAENIGTSASCMQDTRPLVLIWLLSCLIFSICSSC